jgi:hypothetical protein
MWGRLVVVPGLMRCHRFLRDLTRWRPHVELTHPRDLGLFDECVHALWPGQTFPALIGPEYPQGDLDQFRRLLNNIVIAPVVPTASYDTFPLIPSFPLRVDSQHQCHQSHIFSEVIKSVQQDSPMYSSFWKDLDGPVVLLTATVVFGAVLAFFLCKFDAE